MALEKFAPLANVEGVTLISLQHGDGTEQLDKFKQQFNLHTLGDDLDQQTGPFMDTAAVMKNLDLIITSDTATPHLAGALGVPTWLVLPYVSDWRWLATGDRCPWVSEHDTIPSNRAGRLG